MIYEYSMTLRGLLQSVDAEAYASIPLFDELLNTKPEYGSGNRSQKQHEEQTDATLGQDHAQKKVYHRVH